MISAIGQLGACEPRAASVAWLFVQPRQELPSQLRARGTRGSSVSAWLPQKSIARKTGARARRSFERTTIKSMRGEFASLVSMVINFRVAFPPRESRYSPELVSLVCAGRGG